MLPQRGFAVGIDRWQQVYVSEGAEDIKSYRYCSTCKHWRGEQTSHCSACGYCVEEFDHHCGVLGCCIGRLNRRFFVSFLIFTAFAAILCAVQSGIALVELGDRWTVRKAALVLICVAAGYASTVIAFAAVHCVMFVMGTTTAGNLKGRGAGRRRGCGGGGGDGRAIVQDLEAAFADDGERSYCEALRMRVFGPLRLCPLLFPPTSSRAALSPSSIAFV